MWPRRMGASKIRNNVVADFSTTTEYLLPSDVEILPVSPIILPENHEPHNDYNILVSTWNVGGITPSQDLNIDDLLDTHNTSCHIYVIGFQEVVPLNASNVLGPENKKVSNRWNSLIRKTLNNKKSRKVTGSNTESSDLQHDFRCLLSKQMVGLLISVWVRSDVIPFIRNPNVSCVGCGIMGCLGNKGSVSVRFQLHETSFCFVCCHLASGGGEGDERNRNSDANEIFSRTSFPSTKGSSSIRLPRRILDHDQVVVFGDLNYRISLPEKETRSLVDRFDWKKLLEYDQLRTELMDGQFEAWHEGPIDFAPTYKYLPNSDEYFVKNQEMKRAPAWCDRIIWSGEELKQILYTRSESKLSDHRPVKAVFSTLVKASRLACGNFYFSDGFDQISTGLEFVCMNIPLVVTN